MFYDTSNKNHDTNFNVLITANSVKAHTHQGKLKNMAK